MRSVFLLFAATGLVFAATDPSLTRLERQIENVSLATDGVVGVSAFHMESGRTASVRGAEAFPMASAFKLPIAVSDAKGDYTVAVRDVATGVSEEHKLSVR